MHLFSQMTHLGLGKIAVSENLSSAAQRPTIPSPTQSVTSKPNAPGERGMQTGTACPTAAKMVGFSMKSHIISTRLTTSRARVGFLSAIFIKEGYRCHHGPVGESMSVRIQELQALSQRCLSAPSPGPSVRVVPPTHRTNRTW